MRDSNLVIRLSDSERKMVDDLQEKYSINISQYVRNKLTELELNIEGLSISDSIYVPLKINNKIRNHLRELKEKFYRNPVEILSMSVDDENIIDTIETNISYIHEKIQNDQSEPKHE